MADVIYQEIEATACVDELEHKYLTFFTDKQNFAVSIIHVVQIVGMQDITAMPEMPYYVKGIINLRGEIIPVLDMRLRLGRMEIDYDERTCIIVINIHGKHIGMIVDNVDEVIEIPDDIISPTPKVNSGENSYVTSIGKMQDKMVLILDIQMLLGISELDTITEGLNEAAI